MKVRDFVGKHILISAEAHVGTDEILLPWGTYTVTLTTERANSETRLAIYSQNEDLTTLYYDMHDQTWTATITGANYSSSSVYALKVDLI